MERSPEIVFTLDTVVGEGMPKIKDSNDRVEETGKQAIDQTSESGEAEPLQYWSEE